MNHEPKRDSVPENALAPGAQAAALHQAGKLEQAAKLYLAILEDSPNDFDATHLLGVIALQKGDLSAAQRLINAALVLRPHDAAAAGNLGISYLRDNQLEPALQWFEIALKLQPDSPAALINASEALYQLGRFRDAIPLLERACSVEPSSYSAHRLLDACSMRLETVDNFGQTMHPDVKVGASDSIPSVEMLLSLANTLIANGLNNDAIRQLARASALDGRNLTARWALALGQLKAIYESESEVIASRQALGKSLNDLKSWYERTPGVEAPYNTVGTIQPFPLAYQNYNNRELLQRYGELCATFLSSLPPRPAQGGGAKDRPLSERKIRLGIVSAHVREHSIWTAVTKGWVTHLDRKQFEILVFHLDTTVDRETEAVMRSVDHFENRPRAFLDWVETISGQRLDVVLYPEIGSHPLTARLASLRLAPVQAVAWGHPETSGLPTMDLFLSAEAFEPANAAANNYSERLVSLPNLGVYVNPLNLEDAAPDLESLGLPSDQPLLLCPGQPFKYAPRYDEVWVQIAKGLRKRGFIRRVSVGRLVFFRSHNETWDRMFETRLRRAFAHGGVDFDTHVSIVPFLEHATFFGLMRRSALMLDTLGFSGFNTALQGIECALPVLAFEGDFMRGRLASGILRELDLPELVATSPNDFAQGAISLVKSPRLLGELRSKIIERRSRLFRNLVPVRALERYLVEAATHTDPR